MPIYEYQCTECGHQFEELQKFSDPQLVDCPACAQPKLKKLVSAAAFRLKGSGWYETDFKAGNKKNLVDGANSSKDSGDKPASNDNSGSDTKTRSTDSKSGSGDANKSKSSETTKSSATKSGSKD